MKKIFIFLSILLLVSCSPKNKLSKVIEEPKIEKAEPVIEVVKANSLFDILDKLSKSRFYSNFGKVGILYSDGVNSQKIAQGFIENLKGSFLITDIGIDSKNPQEVISQLDFKDVPNLIDIKRIDEEKFEIALYSVKDGEKDVFLFECQFLLEEQKGETLYSIDIVPERAIAIGDKKFIVANKNKIVLVDAIGKTERTIDVTTCNSMSFADLGEGVIYFCKDGVGYGEILNENEKLTIKKSNNFPLPEKMGRLISIFFEGDSFVIYDRRGEILQSFVEIKRLFIEGVTILIGITKEGKLFYIRGDLILSYPILSNKRFKEISCFGENCYALSEDGEIHKIKFDENFNPKISKVNLIKDEGEILTLSSDKNYLYLFLKKEKTEIKQIKNYYLEGE